MATIGIIANPASGKDIRRLVAHSSISDNNEKVNIVRRVLRGADALGIERVLAMPDLFGLARHAHQKADVKLALQLVEIPVTNTTQDSVRAAQMMAAAGVGCIVTLGGDGTNRAVAKGCGYVPLVPISTGTNNAFPVMVEGTVAGLAAAVVAQRVPGVREAAVRIARRLEILRNGALADIALIDAVVYDERFVASGAIWEPAKMRTVVLTRARAGAIGASAIAAYLPEAADHSDLGVWLTLGPGARTIHAPIAPGLMAQLPMQAVRWLTIGDQGIVREAPAVLALDGERELVLRPEELIEIRLTQNGPHVVTIPAALQAASRAGVFANWNVVG